MAGHALQLRPLRAALTTPRVLAAVIVYFAIIQSASADWVDGYNAYRRGDYATAFREWLPLAEQGNALAQFDLGIMYSNGEGVPRDYVEAIKWHRKAADQGLSLSQYNLGVMYATGRGTVQDYVQAHKWFNLAASRLSGSGKETREKALNNRDIVAGKMTPAQIAEAQKLARQWIAAFERRNGK